MNHGFDPEEFLEIARKLKNDVYLPIAGRIRTSVSRAYYAAFLKTKIKLESFGYSFPDDRRLHYDVRECLRSKLKKSDIASNLENLFEYRVIADYEVKKRISEQISEKCIKRSEFIINLIDSL